MADEQAALLAQIRALSGAIDQQKSSRGRRGSGVYHGGGRGRGAATALSRHRTLILAGTNAPDAAASESSTQPEVTDSQMGVEEGRAVRSEEGWVKRKSTHNMSMVSTSAFKKTEPARLAAMAATQSAKTAAAQAKQTSKLAKAKSSNAVRRGDRMGEVIIDGVVFAFDDSGTKLVKKDPQPTASADDPSVGDPNGDAGGPSNPPSSTPLRTSIDGRKFIRTKTGNLISQELLEKRREARRNSERLKRLGEMGRDIGSHQRMRGGERKPKTEGRTVRKRGLCSFYNKTGQCKRGLSCPYVHNPDRIAICPGTLRPSGCVLPKGSCPLSHDHRPERVPHCVHILRLGSCRNGQECLYTHPAPGVSLDNESAICMDFSDLGWCERGDRCEERHTWDCPEFLRKGSCSRKGCKLMHVVRVENLKQREEEHEHDLADADLFVRDDEGAGEERKRKREGDEDGDGDEVEERGSSGDGEQGPTWKAKKTREFDRQQDFISFTDDGEEQVEDETGSDEGEEHMSDSGSNSDHESVHSDSSRE